MNQLGIYIFSVIISVEVFSLLIYGLKFFIDREYSDSWFYFIKIVLESIFLNIFIVLVAFIIYEMLEEFIFTELQIESFLSFIKYWWSYIAILVIVITTIKGRQKYTFMKDLTFIFDVQYGIREYRHYNLSERKNILQKYKIDLKYFKEEMTLSQKIIYCVLEVLSFKFVYDLFSYLCGKQNYYLRLNSEIDKALLSIDFKIKQAAISKCL